jgi:ketosteroid isomerase-like protein
MAWAIPMGPFASCPGTGAGSASVVGAPLATAQLGTRCSRRVLGCPGPTVALADGSCSRGRQTPEEAVMGQARETMDRVTAAIMSDDRDALGRLYAADAVGETPDGPRLQGGAALADYLLTLKRAFPDASFESVMTLEAGDTAIDAGYFVGTHTGVLSTPEGEVPPTGRKLRLRECDILKVADGVAVAHRFYYDPLDFMSQLGLTATGSDSGAAPPPTAGADRPAEPTVR